MINSKKSPTSISVSFTTSTLKQGELLMKPSRKQAIHQLSKLKLPKLPAGIMLGVLMLLVPVHAQSEVSPESEENLTGQPIIIPEDDLDAELPTPEDPTANETVILQGVVLEMIHSRAAVIRDQLDQDILLVSDRDLELTENEAVEMTVTVSDLSLVEANEIYGLALDVPPEMESESIIVATAISNPEVQGNDPLDSPTMTQGSEIEPELPSSTNSLESDSEPSTPPIMQPESGTEIETPSSDNSVQQETMMVRGTVVEVVNPQAVLIDDEINGKMLVISDRELNLAKNDTVEVMGVRSPLSVSEAEETYGLEFPTEMKANLEDATVLISLAYR
jgi:hypothetical protein